MPREAALSAEGLGRLYGTGLRSAGSSPPAAAAANGTTPVDASPAADAAASRFPAGAGVSPQAGDDEPTWPSAESEAAFLAEASAQGDPVVPVSAAPKAEETEEEDEAQGALPSVSSLAEEIPATVRDALEDLFRAKFSRVIRVRKKDLN